MEGISLILPTYHKDRLERANLLYDRLKNESGVPVEVIVVCENPDIEPKHDVLIRPPRRIGFTRAVNLGEKFCTHRLCWWIDDYVEPIKNWGIEAVDGFNKMFPDGMGIMEISGSINDCPKSISTRKFMYSINGDSFLWPEYIHCGDTESWYKASLLGKFYVYPKKLWERKKINDDWRKISLKDHSFDLDLFEERKSNNWPPYLDKNLSERMSRWVYKSKDKEITNLYKNIYNLW